MKNNEWKWKSNDGLEMYAQSWEPDTEPKAIACLVERIAQLEQQIQGAVQTTDECPECESVNVCEPDPKQDQYVMQQASGAK